MHGDALQIATRIRIDNNERDIKYAIVYSYVLACMECECNKGKSRCIRRAMKVVGIDESEFNTVRIALHRIEVDAKNT